MQPFRDIPDVSAAPDGLFDGGHLWVQEAVVGAPFRFQLRESGRLRVGDDEQEYDPEDVPPQYRHVVRHVRETCDWLALQSAVDDVESVVFFGQAMQHRGLDYDWRRTPPFLGCDVWSGTKGDFLGVDTVEHIFDRLGLTPLNTVAKEVRAVDFDPEGYEFPQSAWYDGPVAGVVLRNKRGQCARIDNPDVSAAAEIEVSTTAGTDASTTGETVASTTGETDASTSEDDPAEALADELVTADRVQRVVSALEAQGYPTTFESVYERVLEALFRETPPDRFEGAAFDRRTFRSAVAARTRRQLG